MLWLPAKKLWVPPQRQYGGWNVRYDPTLGLPQSEPTADRFVSASGSDSNTGTQGSPYRTIAHALNQITANQTVGVLTDLTEDFNFTSLSPGANAQAHKTVMGLNGVKTINGSFFGGSGGTNGTQKYLSFRNFQFEGGTDQQDFSNVRNVKMFVCGFFGGPKTGNNVTHLAGTDQLYEECWFGGDGGRYSSLCFQRTNALYRRCVTRTEEGVIDAGSDPSGGIQIYSSTNCARIQCIAVDCLKQHGSYLGCLVVTTNVGAATGIEDIECIVADGKGDTEIIGMQSEGNNNITHTLTRCVVVRCGYGYISQPDSTGTTTINGGEYSQHTQHGIAKFSANGSVSLTGSPNMIGNNPNFSGVSGTITSNALNMNARLSVMKKIGVSGTLRGETGWNVQQADDLFPFPNQAIIRQKFAGLPSNLNPTRGFCGGSFTLTSYLMRAT